MPHTHESRIAEMIEIVKEMKKRGIPVPDMGDKKKAAKADAKPAAKKKVKEAGDTSGLKKVGSLKNAKTALTEDV